LRHKKYNYIRTHDLNGDGRVNSRDRLIWLRKKGGSYAVVYISEDNEDLVEVMDINEDGTVEIWEMEEFIMGMTSMEMGFWKTERLRPR
jgi:hypothetical protein